MNFGFGIVVDINDVIPEAQRVKVRIDSFYDDLPDSDLPWCPVARSNDTGITFNIGVSNHQLVPGSRVFCIFLDEYYQQPMVLCQVPRIMDTNNNMSLDIRTITTKSGHTITIDDSDNPNISIIDCAQNQVLMDFEGIKIKSSSENNKKLNITIESANEINIKSESNISISAGDNISIKGTDITVEADNVDASKSKNVVLPESATSMFTAGPIDTFTGQPNKRSTDGSK